LSDFQGRKGPATVDWKKFTHSIKKHRRWRSTKKSSKKKDGKVISKKEENRATGRGTFSRKRRSPRWGLYRTGEEGGGIGKATVKRLACLQRKKKECTEALAGVLPVLNEGGPATRERRLWPLTWEKKSSKNQERISTEKEGRGGQKVFRERRSQS